MDGFEAAKLKALKRKEKQDKYRPPVLAAEPVEEPMPQLEAPKEKPVADTAAVITVSVRLPDREFAFRLVKPGVYQNAVRSRLTHQAIANGIKEGLKPLLGGVNELPGGG